MKKLQPIKVQSATPGIDGTRSIDGLSESDRADFAFLYGLLAGAVVGFVFSIFLILVGAL